MNTDKIIKGIIVLVLAALVLPPLAYLIFVAGAPSVYPEDARLMLESQHEEVILIDLRPGHEYAQKHLPESLNIPMASLQSKGRELLLGVVNESARILLICDSGILCTRAVPLFKKFGYDDVSIIKGGMDAWIRIGKHSGETQAQIITPGGTVPAPKPDEFSLFEQSLISIAAFFLKPLYEILSLIIVILLWNRAEPDLAAVRRGMMAFFIGETACAVNYIFFNETNLFIDYLHSFGMIISFSFISYAMLEFFDTRVFLYSDRSRKCALLNSCRKCYKHAPVSCTIRTLFLIFTVTALIMIAMPLTAPLGSAFLVGRVFGESIVFGHPVIYQYIEARLFPLTALVLIVPSLLVLLKDGEPRFARWKILFAAGLGPLGFAIFRFMFFWGYADNAIWSDAWEEITEFVLVAFLLWIALRNRGMPSGAAAKPAEAVNGS